MLPLKYLYSIKRSIEFLHGAEIGRGDFILMRALAEKEYERYKNENVTDGNIAYWAECEFIKNYLYQKPKI